MFSTKNWIYLGLIVCRARGVHSTQRSSNHFVFV